MRKSNTFPLNLETIDYIKEQIKLFLADIREIENMKIDLNERIDKVHHRLTAKNIKELKREMNIEFFRKEHENICLSTESFLDAYNDFKNKKREYNKLIIKSKINDEQLNAIDNNARVNFLSISEIEEKLKDIEELSSDERIDLKEDYECVKEMKDEIKELFKEEKKRAAKEKLKLKMAGIKKHLARCEAYMKMENALSLLNEVDIILDKKTEYFNNLEERLTDLEIQLEDEKANEEITKD